MWYGRRGRLCLWDPKQCCLQISRWTRADQSQRIEANTYSSLKYVYNILLGYGYDKGLWQSKWLCTLAICCASHSHLQQLLLSPPPPLVIPFSLLQPAPASLSSSLSAQWQLWCPPHSAESLVLLISCHPHHHITTEQLCWTTLTPHWLRASAEPASLRNRQNDPAEMHRPLWAPNTTDIGSTMTRTWQQPTSRQSHLCHAIDWALLSLSYVISQTQHSAWSSAVASNSLQCTHSRRVGSPSTPPTALATHYHPSSWMPGDFAKLCVRICPQTAPW